MTNVDWKYLPDEQRSSSWEEKTQELKNYANPKWLNVIINKTNQKGKPINPLLPDGTYKYQRTLKYI